MLVGSLLVCDHTNRRLQRFLYKKWQGRNPEKQTKNMVKRRVFLGGLINWEGGVDQLGRGVDQLEGGLINWKGGLINWKLWMIDLKMGLGDQGCFVDNIFWSNSSDLDLSPKGS